MDRVAGLLLAAGAGRRLGAPKALLKRDDDLLVEDALGVLREAGCDPLVVVLGSAAEQVRTEADLGEAIVVDNPDWENGQGSSLRAGLAALAGTPAEAVVVLLVDTPGVTAEAVRRVAALPYPNALVVATYGGRRGHPALLGRAHWPGIAALAKGDLGARPYLQRQGASVLEVACDGVANGDDVDTPDAATRWGIVLPPDLRPPAAPPVPPPPAPPVPPPAGAAPPAQGLRAGGRRNAGPYLPGAAGLSESGAGSPTYGRSLRPGT